MEMSLDIDIEIREQVFHNAVREYIIFLLLFILLYVSSYAVVCLFKRKPDSEDMFAGPVKRTKKRYLEDFNIPVPRSTLYYKKKKNTLALVDGGALFTVHVQEKEDAVNPDNVAETSCGSVGDPYRIPDTCSVDADIPKGWKSTEDGPQSEVQIACLEDGTADLHTSNEESGGESENKSELFGNSSSDFDTTTDDDYDDDLSDGYEHDSTVDSDTISPVKAEMAILSCFLRNNLPTSACKDVLLTMKNAFPNCSSLKQMKYNSLWAHSDDYAKEIHFCESCSEIFPDNKQLSICGNCSSPRYKQSQLPRASFVLANIKRQFTNLLKSPGEDDAMVYRIALWICTLTLATSAGAVLLLPISIISNEVLHLYPKSYYVKWLNSSLIHGLWNQVFLLSNIALFILLPFAYFFTESEGFSGTRKGLKGRIYETVLVLGLLAILVLGLAYVASAIMNDDDHSKETLFDVWNIYLPYLYSCISFLGVLVLLLCTPMGFTIMFTVMGQLVIKPKFLTNIDEELSTVLLEEEDLLRKIEYKTRNHVSSRMSNGHANKDSLTEKLETVRDEKRKLERKKQVSSWRRNLGYPLVMLLSLALTVLSVLMVVHNTFQLLIGIKALPVGVPETVLGLDSLSALGPVGAALEIIVILYLMLASVVGFFSLPYIRRLQPKSHDTPMQKIIGNCIVILVLSSALPILSKTLGITNFDLIGNFGSMDWLGNFYIILGYNVVFAVATGLCLFKKFTATVRREIYDRLISAFRSDRRTWSFTSMNGGIKED